MNNSGRWISSRWVRREYRIVNGDIRPVPGSRLEEYDPFDFYFGRDSSNLGKSLYQKLADLDTDSDAAIEQFTCRWGLLGLLFDPLIQIRYWRPGTREEVSRGVRPVGFYQVWSTSPDLVHECVSPEWIQMMEDGGWNGSVITEESFPSLYEEQPLQTYAAPYFPDGGKPNPRSSGGDGLYTISDRRLFSILDASTRWDYLSEPVDRFRRAADQFRSTYREGHRWKKRGGADGDLERLKRHLDDHVRHVHPILMPEWSDQRASDWLSTSLSGGEGGVRSWKMGWSFPSLLSAAYMMLLQDLAGNRDLRFCANETCGNTVVSHRSDTRFCSPNCKNAQNQRLHRARRSR